METAMETTVYLMRHGEVHNPGKILYGRLPGYYLSEAGRQQAHAAGRWLQDKPIRAVYASPMERTQQTAQIVSEYHPPLSPITDERLIEICTPHEGRLTAELEALNWDLYSGNQPPYEVPQTVLERVLDFFDFVIQAHPGEAVVAVGHGDILVFPWLHAHGAAPPAQMAHMKDRLRAYQLPVDYPATASLMHFTFRASPRQSRPQVSYFCPY